MRSFLKGIQLFSVVVIITYLIVVWLCAHLPFLEQRWSRGIPNWAEETSAGEKLKVFNSFCESHKGDSINCIVGSSTALHGINPKILGNNWFNASTRGQNLIVSEAYVEILHDIAEANDVRFDTIILDVYPELQQEWVVNKMDAVEDMALSIPLNPLFKHQSIFLHGRFSSRLHARLVYHLKRHSTQISNNTAQDSWREFSGYEPLKSVAFQDDRPLLWDNLLSPSIVDLRLLNLHCQALVLHNPPTIHKNHRPELLHSMPWLHNYTWIDGHACTDILDTAYFHDDHHMNDHGAQLYSAWVKSQLREK